MYFVNSPGSEWSIDSENARKIWLSAALGRYEGGCFGHIEFELAFQMKVKLN